VIRVEELSKSYGSVKALDAISLEVNQGEILGLLGPNGAGKTTTLKILSGYLRPDSGAVDIKGLNGVEQTEQTRALLGYLPEYNPLYQDLLVYDYLHYIAAMRGMPVATREQRVAEMVELCGLVPAVNFKVGELSKGNRQRVGLAQAMIHDPEILILDEPTAGLDPNQISEIRDLIRQLGRKKTVILSSHILSEVEATCDRVVIIHRGRVVADGSTKMLQSQASGDAKIVVKLGAGKSREVISAFKGLPGVVNAERGEDEGSEIQGYTLHCDHGTDLRPEVSRLVQKEGWVLYELRRDVVSLEDVFKQLTAQ
jgi:ABC-2 type transport system ATP-binding protein